ncbi:hypothetical protein AB1Y20_011772 [Prymnesium parvum]|uniref:Transmembrane protein n=1 Tax=Prymnesium parvum TaxID=97485 RepID=A0AB34IKT6_PRYPA
MPPALPAPVVDSLLMLSLATLWLATYFIVCAFNGQITAVESVSADVPSSVFALGGVFGMRRPVLEIIWRTTASALFGVAALMVCDIVYARRTLARWFALHFIANLWISILCLPDLWYLLSNPIEALTQTSVNHWPTSLVFSVHVYHMCFFRNLQWIDWLHHVLMVVIGAPMLITGEVGPLMNFNHFFMCGVPGGADYAMLFAVKHGWMQPLEEKRYNKHINVWVRAPALVATAVLAKIQVHLQGGVPAWVSTVRVLLMILAGWNGLFFMERVVGNYHVCAYKERHDLRSKSGEQSSTEYDETYTTKEHLSGILPGFGGAFIRTSVSSQDLEELHASSAGAQAKKAN